ncbi:MAG: hypothetical protein ACOY4C_04020 [Pseudomonadota bacterium]|jgi:predicted small lipoprotein YifL
MKKVFLTLAAVPALALSLAACDDSPPPQPDPNAPVIVDDECPRADGEPCR